MSSKVNESTVSPVVFVDPSQMTQRAQWCLVAQVLLAVIAMAIGILEYRLLLDYENQVFLSLQEARSAGYLSDLRQMIIACLQWFVVVISAVFILRWMQLVNDNVRRLGALGMKFSSLWVVAWFFVPLANLWKLYLAIREVAKCSSSPLAWHAEPVSPLVAWWWGLLLSYGTLLVAAVYYSVFSDGIARLQLGSALSLAADVLGIAVCVVFYFVVQQINRLQLKQSEFVLIE